jgi:hypothetical protein
MAFGWRKRRAQAVVAEKLRVLREYRFRQRLRTHCRRDGSS